MLLKKSSKIIPVNQVLEGLRKKSDRWFVELQLKLQWM